MSIGKFPPQGHGTFPVKDRKMLHSIARTRWILAFLCIILCLVVASSSYADVIEHGTEEFCQLSGFVYHDVNNDGTRGSEEMLLPEIEVTLTGVTTSDEIYTVTTTTGDTGTYCFTGIPAGTYAVIETQPEILHTAMANPVGTAGGEINGSNEFIEIELETGMLAENYNFGELGLKARYMSKRHFIGVMPVPVPEPATLTLFGMLFGAGTLYVLRRRR